MRIENHHRVFASGFPNVPTMSAVFFSSDVAADISYIATPIGHIKVAALAEWCRAAVREMPAGPVRHGLDVHQRVCEAIAEFAPGCDCLAEREYRVSDGFIDVVWLKDGEPVVAFEIKGWTTKKSVEKLLSQQCTRCVVSLRDAPLKWATPDGIHHIVLGVRPWRSSRYNPTDI